MVKATGLQGQGRLSRHEQGVEQADSAAAAREALEASYAAMASTSGHVIKGFHWIPLR